MSDNVTIMPLSAHIARKISEECEYGDLVTCEQLHKWLEVSDPGGKVSTEEHQRLQFKRLSAIKDTSKRLLEDYSILFENRKGVGYVLVEPEEQTQVVIDKLKCKLRLHGRKAVSGLTNIRMDYLTDQQRKENLTARSNLAGLRSMMRKQLKQFTIGPPEEFNGNDDD